MKVYICCTWKNTDDGEGVCFMYATILYICLVFILVLLKGDLCKGVQKGMWSSRCINSEQTSLC